MKEYTDKQLLQMTKVELVKLIRQLEILSEVADTEPMTVTNNQDMIERLQSQGYIVKERVSYELR